MNDYKVMVCTNGKWRIWGNKYYSESGATDKAEELNNAVKEFFELTKTNSSLRPVDYKFRVDKVSLAEKQHIERAKKRALDNNVNWQDQIQTVEFGVKKK